MKIALGKIPTNRKWRRSIPSGKSSMSKGTKVGERGQIREPAGKERQKEGWSISRARHSARLLMYTVVLGFYKDLARYLLFLEETEAQKGHTAHGLVMET